MRPLIPFLITVALLGGVFFVSRLTNVSPMIHHGATALFFALIILAPITMLANALYLFFIGKRTSETFFMIAMGIFFCIVLIPKYWQPMFDNARAMIHRPEQTQNNH